MLLEIFAATLSEAAPLGNTSDRLILKYVCAESGMSEATTCITLFTEYDSSETDLSPQEVMKNAAAAKARAAKDFLEL
jgi:hypothetical protein